MADLSVLQDVGVLGTIAIGMGVLIRYMVQKNNDMMQKKDEQIDIMIKRSFEQSDVILQLARSTISANTEALEKLTASIMDDIKIHLDHIKQKDTILTKMKDCQRDRDQKLDSLLKKNGRG